MYEVFLELFLVLQVFETSKLFGTHRLRFPSENTLPICLLTIWHWHLYIRHVVSCSIIQWASENTFTLVCTLGRNENRRSKLRQISWNNYECGQLNRRRKKERIAAGNRSFFANKKIFQSKLITRKTKERLYHTAIRPVAVYGSECWVLTENIKQKLLVIKGGYWEEFLAQRRKQMENGDKKQMSSWKTWLTMKI